MRFVLLGVVVLGYVLLAPVIWLLSWFLLYFVERFSLTAANWVEASLVAAGAVALLVFVGLTVLHVTTLLSSFQRVIKIVVPSQLYEIIRTTHILKRMAPIVLILGVMVVGLPLRISTWPEHRKQGAMLAERETVQTAMNAMMVDRNITTVTPNDNTHSSLGVNTWTGLPEGANTKPLGNYLRKGTTIFYYCWDSKGKVYAQNKKDGVRAEPKYAEKQRLC